MKNNDRERYYLGVQPKLFKKYDELTSAQKKSARAQRPNDYTEWYYVTAGERIELIAR